MTGEGIALTLVNPEVMSVTAQHRPLEDTHVAWYVDFAPDSDNDDPRGRVVFGTLHGTGGHGLAEVTIASTVLYECDGEPSNEDFKAALLESEALETLYDIARLTFRTVSGIVGVDAEVERKAPVPEVSVLRTRAEVEAESKDEGS